MTYLPPGAQSSEMFRVAVGPLLAALSQAQYALEAGLAGEERAFQAFGHWAGEALGDLLLVFQNLNSR